MGTPKLVPFGSIEPRLWAILLRARELSIVAGRIGSPSLTGKGEDGDKPRWLANCPAPRLPATPALPVHVTGIGLICV